MRVLAIDGGIVNVGVCVVEDGSIELVTTDQIHPTSRVSPSELAGLTSEWVCDRAEPWRLEDVDLVIIESVVRAKINAVGTNIIAAISTWFRMQNKGCPRFMMKAGRSKFGVNPSLRARALSSKGKSNYENRKLLSVEFCNICWSETEGCGPDACDALLLAVAGIKQLTSVERRPFDTLLTRCEEGRI